VRSKTETHHLLLRGGELRLGHTVVLVSEPHLVLELIHFPLQYVHLSRTPPASQRRRLELPASQRTRFLTPVVQTRATV
jgi:hypothetical protein